MIVTTEMRKEFRLHLKKQWEEDATLREIFSTLEDVYGWQEIEEVTEFIVKPTEKLIKYGQRELVQPENEDVFIRSGNLEWMGDDVDYYGEILDFFVNHYKEA